MSWILPCPMCSHVIYRPKHGDKPIDVRPQWILAKNASRAAGKNLFLWIGCKHSDAVGPKAAVDEDLRSLTEARWDQEARRLFTEKTAAWNETPRSDFGRALGFTTPAEVSP